MSQNRGFAAFDNLQKIASIAFILGAVLLIIFNLLSPRPDDPTSQHSVLTMMSDRGDFTQLSQLMLALGIWLAMIGFAGVYRSISGNGAAWARLGFYSTVVGTALWTATFGLGSATVNAAADWTQASLADKDSAYSIAAAISNTTSGLETMSIIIFWLALIFLGIGIARSSVFPKWLGWAAAVLGAVMVAAVGIPKFIMGNSSTLLILFGVLAGLTTVWMLAAGIWLFRKAWQRSDTGVQIAGSESLGSP